MNTSGLLQSEAQKLHINFAKDMKHMKLKKHKCKVKGHSLMSLEINNVSKPGHCGGVSNMMLMA